MVVIKIDLGPKQPKITEDKILEMIQLKPRRIKFLSQYTDYYGIHPPRNQGDDWSVLFPFYETFANVFEAMCTTGHIGVRLTEKGKGFTYLSDTANDTVPPEQVVRVCEIIGNYVAIRDCMALSFALDYDHCDGDPRKPHTEVGKLRSAAKPRDGGTPTTEAYKKGVFGLRDLCLKFIEDIVCYENADCIVAMPPSRSGKKYDIPRDLAKLISEQTDIENLSQHVRTIKIRKQLKGVKYVDRLDEIKDTIEVDPKVFKGKNILLIDDVYQSGVSMNYVAMLLQQSGADKIFGLACDKTCSNKDNIG
jgi:hypothetical protein